MKIIQQGNYKPKVNRFECEHCGCVFECNENECKSNWLSNGHFLYFNCPTCNDFVSVKMEAQNEN